MDRARVAGGTAINRPSRRLTRAQHLSVMPESSLSVRPGRFSATRGLSRRSSVHGLSSPRNDQLDAELLHRIEHADYLYVSHLHGDHHDALACVTLEARHPNSPSGLSNI